MKVFGVYIKQVDITIPQAREIGLIADGGIWTENMVKHEKPDVIIRQYSFGGIIGGFIWEELPDIVTLTEFEQNADDIAEQIWRDYQYMIEWDFLDNRITDRYKLIQNKS